MATRVLGPTGSRRRRRFLFASLILVACTALFMAGSAQAVHEFVFQLDGEVSTQAYTTYAASVVTNGVATKQLACTRCRRTQVKNAK